MPTWLVKECVHELAPLITRVINKSLTDGIVPGSLKDALVRPLIKKSGMDTSSLKNYRPVSNLPLMAKLLEKVVATRMDAHLQSCHLHTTFQSAYKPHHSTETALLRVQSDILRALDQGSSCILVLLDLSAAFDTLDHRTLLQRLSTTFGIKGVALRWMTSYLENRHQTVVINDKRSQPVCLEYGVPQGSVLGPKLYSLYTKPLADIMEDKCSGHHFFADDSQLYQFFKAKCTTSLHQAITNMEVSVQVAQELMVRNKLKCNADKTEVLTITPKGTSIAPVSLMISGSEIQSKDVVRNLGIYQDSHLSMEKQVNHLCRTANFHLKRIGAIRRYLTTDATKSLVRSLVVSRLDYCNSLLFGLPDVLINKIQRVQNKAARVVSRTPRQEHITPILRDMHWLPVQRRIEYKVLLYTFKSLHDLSPEYLKDLVQHHQSSRTLRSNHLNQLSVPRTRTRYGDRTFSHAAACLWNSLPSHLTTICSIDCFKRSLKTHLFKVQYDS